MAQIQTYPRKTTYDANDLILICDKTPDANGVVTNDTKTTNISTIADNLNVVETFTSSFGTYISGTANAAAKGAVSIGTLNLSAVDGTAVIGTRFLSKDNTWDVPAFVTSVTTFNNSGVAITPTTGDVKVGIDILTLTDLSTGALGSDLLFAVDDPSGTPINKKISIDNFFSTVGLITNSSINYTVKLPNTVGTANQILKLPSTIGSTPHELTWSDDDKGVVGSGSINNLPLWKNATELTNSSISQDASADVTIGGAILNITPYVFGGLKIKDDGSQVTLSGPGATVIDYGLKLPDKPTAGGQALVLPSTLGSSPYQLEWSGVVTGHTVAPLLTSGSNITNNSTYDKQAILVQDVWTGGSYIPLSMSAFTPSTYDTSNPGKTGFAIYKGTIKESSSAIALSGSYLAERVAVGCHDIALTVNPGNDIKLFPGDFFVFVMFLEGDGSATANWAGASAVNDVDLCGLTAIEVAWPTSGAFPTLNSLITAGTVTTPRICPAVTLQLS